MGFFDNLKSSLAETGQDLSQKAITNGGALNIVGLLIHLDRNRFRSAPIQIGEVLPDFAYGQIHIFFAGVGGICRF